MWFRLRNPGFRYLISAASSAVREADHRVVRLVKFQVSCSISAVSSAVPGVDYSVVTHAKCSAYDRAKHISRVPTM